MKDLTIRHRILGSFAVVLTVMIVMGYVAFTRLARIEREASSMFEFPSQQCIIRADSRKRRCGARAPVADIAVKNSTKRLLLAQLRPDGAIPGAG